MKRTISGVAVLGLMTSGCGGSGGGAAPTVPVVTAPNPTPTPSPTPSPSPTATPTPTAGTSQPNLLTLNTDTSLGGFAGSNGYHRTQAGAVTFTEDYATAAATPYIYRAETRSFTFISYDRVIPNERLTAPVSLALDSARSSSSFVEYRGEAAGIAYRYSQLVPGPDNPLLALLYSSIAIARTTYVDTAAGMTRLAVTPMVFGFAFDPQKAVLTGSATYTGVALGHARGIGSRVYEVEGTVRVALNHDTGVLTGRIVLTGRDDLTGEMVNLGTFDIRQFSPQRGTGYYSAETQSDGRLQAQLIGAMAEEFIAALDVKIADPRTAGAMLKLAVVMAARR